MPAQKLARLLNPRSLALVGASPRPGSLGRAVLASIMEGGFEGRIDLVNPRHESVDGLAYAPSLADLPEAPDLAVIAAPREAAFGLAAQAAARGVAGAVVITADPDPAAHGLAQALRKLSRESGMRVVGPGSLGVINPRTHLNASYAAQKASPGDLAVISQTGAVTAALIAWAHERGAGFSGLVSLGGMADVDFADLLDYYALDGATRAILLSIESIGDVRAFMSAARAAARAKPVIVIKAGRYEPAGRGRAASTDAVYDAAFRRAGLLRVRDINELFSAAEAVGRVKSFPGKRLAILTNGLGIATLAADRLIELGGVLAQVSEATRIALDAALPGAWSHGNPIDIGGDADAARFGLALAPLLEDRACDAVLVVHAPTALSKDDEVAAAIVARVTANRAKSFAPKPVFASWPGGTPAALRLFEAAHIPHYEAGAVRGFMHLVHWRENRDALMATPPSLPVGFAPDAGRARAIVAAALAKGAHALNSEEIAQVLDAYAIPTTRPRFAATPEAAGEAARELLREHAACVVKIQSPDIVYKSDVGGMRLGLASVEAVREAARAMLEGIGLRLPQARLDGVTVHPMIERPNARELAAGFIDDPTFGPLIVFGRGGKAADVINDRALALPPLDLALAHDLIAQTRVARALQAYRDVAAADLAAAALTLVKLAQLAADVPQLREAVLDPLFADADGVLTVNARMAIAPRALDRRSRFAITPYPKHWERCVPLPNGSVVFVRPVRPEDEAMYRAFFEAQTADDVRLRFFAPVRDFNHAFVARLTQIDYARTIALCALDDAGAMLGGVRLVSDAQSESGEFAILVRGASKGRGLGEALMRLMMEWAREHGLREVEGEVLAENAAMLALCAHLGFSAHDEPHEPGVKRVVLAL